MFPSYHTVFGAAILVAAWLLSGCGSRGADDQKKAATPSSKTTQNNAQPAGPAAHEGPASMSVPSGLAELSAEDRAIAEKQRICPVSGDILGAHGKPYKVTVKEQVVFLCCPACEKELLANPGKYLAKLKTEKPK